MKVTYITLFDTIIPICTYLIKPKIGFVLNSVSSSVRRSKAYRQQKSEMDNVLSFLSKDFLSFSVIACSIFLHRTSSVTSCLHPLYISTPKNSSTTPAGASPNHYQTDELKKKLFSCCFFLIDDSDTFLSRQQRTNLTTLCALFFDTLIDMFYCHDVRPTRRRRDGN